jgi:hypothetical protein
MNEFEGLKRFGTRSGFRLADVVDVAMPVYSVNVTALTLAHKRVSPIDEFVLRSIAMGMSKQSDLVDYLGLPEEVIRPSLAALAQGDQIALTAKEGVNAWAVTTLGRKALESAMQVVAEERTIPIVFDALLRRTVSLKTEALLEFKNLKAEGRFEIQMNPPKRPTSAEISPTEIEKLFARSGSNDDQRRDILCIRGLESKSIKKRFIPAIALLFISLDEIDIQLGFVVSNQLSEEHANAFAGTSSFQEIMSLFRKNAGEQKAELQDVLQDVQLARFPSIDVDDPVTVAELLRDKVEHATSELRDGLPNEREELLLKLKAAEDRLTEAEQRATDVGFRYLSVVDHPPLLADAVKSAKRRLLIISPWISGAVVNGEFLRNLESSLKRGVKVYIGYGISGEEHTKPIDQNHGLKQLVALANKYPEFRLKRFGNTHAKVLIKDSEFSATTSFNWLSFKGDPNRTFRDEQGVLIHAPQSIDSKFEELLLRFV